jgi:transcriptional regulator with XRE-family HTH domain
MMVVVMANKNKDSQQEKLQFSKMLRKLLKDRSITQKQAASLAGVTESVLSDWISGCAPQNLIAVRRLAKSLGVSVSYLLFGESDDGFKISLEELIKTEDAPVISGLYRLELTKIKIAEHLLKKEK